MTKRAEGSDLTDQKGWIYICMDLRHPEECKIGMTKRALFKRLIETGNPSYMIVKAYKIPLKEALAIERYLHRKIPYQQKIHFLTGRKSEWFDCSPAEASKAIEPELANCLGGFYDEDGNYDLSSIIFKPTLDEGNALLVAERIGSTKSYNNLKSAIEEC